MIICDGKIQDRKFVDAMMDMVVKNCVHRSDQVTAMNGKGHIEYDIESQIWSLLVQISRLGLLADFYLDSSTVSKGANCSSTYCLNANQEELE